MNGFFHYRSSRPGTPLLRVAVKDCPDPAEARQLLEELLETPVRWEAS